MEDTYRHRMESASDTRNIRRGTVKALLFSNFPREVYESSLKPKFIQHGVEVVRIANIDRSPNVDVGEVDIIVAMIELMSSGQRAKVKDLARRTGKRFIGLSRKGADWGREFADVSPVSRVPPSRAPISTSKPSWTPVVVPAPASEPEPELEGDALPDLGELRDMLSLFEQENEKLEERIKELEAQDRSGAEKDLIRRLQVVDEELRAQRAAVEKARSDRDQHVSETRRVKKELEDSKKKEGELVNKIAQLVSDKCDLEDALKLTHAQAGDQRQFVENAQRQVGAFQATIDALSKELEDAKALVKKQSEELYRAKQSPSAATSAELEKLRKENQQLKERPPSSGTMKTTEDFIKLREALATVWRLGAMTDRDVLDKLMNWQPKE